MCEAANLLKKIFPLGYIPITKAGNAKQSLNKSVQSLKTFGENSEQKKRVFVAMPFAKDFNDCYHYGIQKAVKASGYLCERADLESFTGDVMEWVKKRITTAQFVIADLTTANPNVYLELGDAWGQNKQAILLIKDAKELKFDTRGHKCLSYESIQDLETKLKKELRSLKL